MNKKEIIEDLFSECLETMNSKGAAYAGTADILANFRRNAKRLGLAPAQVWLVYYAKHVDTIVNAIKANPENPVDKTEGLKGRIVDCIVYLWLLGCLLNRPPTEYLPDGSPSAYDPMTPDQRLETVNGFIIMSDVKNQTPNDMYDFDWSAEHIEENINFIAECIKRNPHNPGSALDIRYIMMNAINHLVILRINLVKKAEDNAAKVQYA